jgi:hypothetical protein
MLLAQVETWIGLTMGGLSSMSVFMGLHWLLDSFLWKIKLLRRILLVPDLNGTWTVKGIITHAPNRELIGREWHADLEITQSWSAISIFLKTNQSRSRSDSASITHAAGEGFILAFHYGNRPGINEPNLQQHAGTCRLSFDIEGRSGEGIYFNDHNRQTAGSMTLKRKGKS